MKSDIQISILLKKENLMGTLHNDEAMVMIEDAAEELSTTGLRLLMLLRDGTLIGQEVNGEWMITRSSLEQFRQAGLPAATQKGCASSCQAAKCGCH
jgi:hypothetical protein